MSYSLAEVRDVLQSGVVRVAADFIRFQEVMNTLNSWDDVAKNVFIVQTMVELKKSLADVPTGDVYISPPLLPPPARNEDLVRLFSFFQKMHISMWEVQAKIKTVKRQVPAISTIDEGMLFLRLMKTLSTVLESALVHALPRITQHRAKSQPPPVPVTSNNNNSKVVSGQRSPSEPLRPNNTTSSSSSSSPISSSSSPSSSSSSSSSSPSAPQRQHEWSSPSVPVKSVSRPALSAAHRTENAQRAAAEPTTLPKAQVAKMVTESTSAGPNSSSTSSSTHAPPLSARRFSWSLPKPPDLSAAGAHPTHNGSTLTAHTTTNEVAQEHQAVSGQETAALRKQRRNSQQFVSALERLRQRQDMVLEGIDDVEDRLGAAFRLLRQKTGM